MDNTLKFGTDELGRTNSISFKDGNKILIGEQYNFDTDGNISIITDLVNSSRGGILNYDANDHLINNSNFYGENIYEYDNGGNIIKIKQNTNNINLVYKNNRLISNNGTLNENYNYDEFGNLLNINGKTLNYNGGNELIKVIKNGINYEFKYDSFGNRLKLLKNGKQNPFHLYLDEKLLYEKTNGKEIIYIYLKNKLIYKETNSVGTYLFSNLWGSPIAKVDKNKKLLWEQVYMPYGLETIKNSKNNKNYWSFTGKVLDSEIGLIYMNSRWYDPLIGRFLNEDQASISSSNWISFNKYAYAGNNPMKYIDPNGMNFWGNLWNGLINFGASIAIGFGDGMTFQWKAGVNASQMNDLELIGYNSGFVGAGMLSIYSIPKKMVVSAATIGYDTIFTLKNINSIETPYGLAKQEFSFEAKKTKTEVLNGAKVYKGGNLKYSNGPESQFWAIEHPMSKNYAFKFGIPEKNFKNMDFVVRGVILKDTKFITRADPGVGDNAGGAIEVVILEITSFTML